MKNLIAILGFLLIFTSYSLGQSEVEKIATDICTELQTLNLNEDSELVNKKSIEIIQDIYQSKQDLIKTLVKKYSQTYIGKSEVEISKIVGQDITFHLMKDCEVYQRITMFKNGHIPNISTTTEKIGDDFTELLTQRIKTESISTKIVDDCMNKSMDKNKNELIKKYGSKYSVEFIEEFKAYLLTKCEPYMKWTTSMIK